MYIHQVPKPWPGVRADPNENSVVLLRRLMLLKLSPRCRQWLEASLEYGGDVDKGADKVGLSRAAARKELLVLRKEMVLRGLAKL